MPGGGQPAQGWSGVVSQEGMIYVGSMKGEVVAVNSSTRNLEWSYALPIQSSSSIMSCGRTSAPAPIYGTPAVDGDLVYIGSYNGKVLALSSSARSQGLPFPQARSGEWLYSGTEEVIGGIVASPVVDEDAIYVTSSDGRVYSLNRDFGDLNWKSDILGEKLWTLPVIESDTIYVSTFDGYIYALSTETGKKLPWSFKAEVGFVSSPVLYKDIIFVGSFDNNLYAIKIGDDKALWKFPASRWFWAALVVKDGVVYAGCLDGKIYAITGETGEELWEFDTGSPIVSSPVLVDDLLVVAAESGNVFVINSKTGDKERVRNPGTTSERTIDAPVRASLCAHEGMVYIHAQDDRLYVVDINERKVHESFPLTIK